MSKLYRLKKEVKEYLHDRAEDEFFDCIAELKWWEENSFFKLEALEEVESNIEVYIVEEGNPSEPNTLCKKNFDWTEQERELVEFVINEFGDIKNLDNKINDYACYFSEKDGFANLFEWLKQRKD